MTELARQQTDAQTTAAASSQQTRSRLLSASHRKNDFSSRLTPLHLVSPFCSPWYPILRRASDRPVPIDLRAVSHGV